MKLSKYNPLSWLASLRVTVVLLAMAMYLIFVGTLAQVEAGIWQVVDEYFRSWFVRVKFDVFRSILNPGSTEPWKGAHWFPSGFLVIGALLVNLVAAHAVRFKIMGKGKPLWIGVALIAVGTAVTAYTVLHQQTSARIQQDVMLMLGIWSVPMAVIGAGCYLVFGKRKAGIVLVHAGLILMLLGEYITGLGAEEGRMLISEFGSSNVVIDTREVELAFVSQLEDGRDRHIVVPQPLIEDADETDEQIKGDDLPLSIRVDEWMPNSKLGTRGSAVLTDPTKVKWIATEVPEVTGTEQSEDRPSVMVSFYQGDQRLGQHLLSTWPYVPAVPIEVNGKTYQVSLRFKHTHLPYSLQLDDFRHDTFTGTRTAKNYSSDLRLELADRENSRDAFIKMNQPLRYDNKAFFQSGFFQQPLNKNLGTILQVVDNPGAWVPYLSCVIVTMGLAIHFIASLIRFERRLNA